MAMILARLLRGCWWKHADPIFDRDCACGPRTSHSGQPCTHKWQGRSRHLPGSSATSLHLPATSSRHERPLESRYAA